MRKVRCCATVACVGAFAMLTPLGTNASAAATAIDAPGWVCIPDSSNPAGSQVVSQKKLADWLFENVLQSDPHLGFDPVQVLSGYHGEDERFASTIRPNGAVGVPKKDEHDQTLDAIKGTRQTIFVMWRLNKTNHNHFFGTGSGFDQTAWLLGEPAGGTILCNADYKPQAPSKPPGANGAPTWSWTRFRVRGVPDTLGVDRTYTAPSLASPTAANIVNPIFSSSDGATVSFAYDGVKKSQTEILKATLGYVFDLSHDISLVPYGQINRSITGTKGGPTTYASDLFDFGAVGSWDYHGAAWGNYLSFQPHFAINGNDASRQVALHFQDIPVLDRYMVNDYWVSSTDPSTAVAIAFLFDLRGDAATFTDRGTAPTTNLDYFRLGTHFGATASLGFLNSDVTVADTWLYGFTGSLRRLNDFQASWTYYTDPTTKFFGLSVAYKIGRIEATAQKEQSWLVSLTGKY